MADGRAKVEEVLREVAGLKAQLSDRLPKVNQDWANLGQELAKQKKEIRVMSRKPELTGLPAADVAVPAASEGSCPARSHRTAHHPQK
jgi:hypothetical protein